MPNKALQPTPRPLRGLAVTERWRFEIPRLGLLFALLMIITVCCDQPLFSTPLPNGYSLKSNGREFGYVVVPDGARMAEHFGILDNGEEQWCGRFGWEGDFVACEVVEYTNNSLETKSKGYFFLNSQTGEVVIFPSEKEVKNYWQANLRQSFPRLARSYPGTVTK